jgi:hypothetical protein
LRINLHKPSAQFWQLNGDIFKKVRQKGWQQLIHQKKETQSGRCILRKEDNARLFRKNFSV